MVYIDAVLWIVLRCHDLELVFSKSYVALDCLETCGLCCYVNIVHNVQEQTIINSTACVYYYKSRLYQVFTVHICVCGLEL